MYFLFVLFLLAALTCFTLEYWRKVRYWQRRHVPCPRQHWLWGNMEGYQHQQSFNDIFHEFYKEFRQTTLPLLGVYIFVKPVALITDLQLAKRILTKDFSYFHDRGLYHNPDDLTGNLFTLDYDKWKVFRTNLSPSFTSGKLKRMLTTFVTTSNVLIEVMEQDIMGGDNILDIKDLMLRYTLEIVGACGFGCQTHSLQNPKDQFYQLIQNTFIEILRLYPVSPLIIRQCSADYSLPTHPDIVIAKGQMVIIPAYSFQRDENYFHQAETFNPDNFAADRSNSSFLLSFGEGPRNCIGMRFAKIQMTVGLILLLSRFTFSFCDKTENPIVLNKKSVLLTPQNGIYLKVEKYQH